VDCHSELLILQVCLEINGLETVQTVRVTIVTEVTKHFVFFPVFNLKHRYNYLNANSAEEMLINAYPETRM